MGLVQEMTGSFELFVMNVVSEEKIHQPSLKGFLLIDNCLTVAIHKFLSDQVEATFILETSGAVEVSGAEEGG